MEWRGATWSGAVRRERVQMPERAELARRPTTREVGTPRCSVTAHAPTAPAAAAAATANGGRARAAVPAAGFRATVAPRRPRKRIPERSGNGAGARWGGKAALPPRHCRSLHLSATAAAAAAGSPFLAEEAGCRRQGRTLPRRRLSVAPVPCCGGFCGGERRTAAAHTGGGGGRRRPMGADSGSTGATRGLQRVWLSQSSSPGLARAVSNRHRMRLVKPPPPYRHRLLRRPRARLHGVTCTVSERLEPDVTRDALARRRDDVPR